MKNISILLGVILLTIFFPCYAQTSTNSDIKLIKKRITLEFLDTKVKEASVEELMTTIKEDGSWPGINYIDVSRTGFRHETHLKNLLQMSCAYKKSNSKLKGDPNLKKTISSALDFWLKNDFICDNWWWNQIGTPNALTAVLFLMDKDLTKEQIEKTSAITARANMSASGARPSGDRIKIAGILAKNAIFNYNDTLFESTIKIIEGEIKFSSERGMQYDYSFHHRIDRVNNTLSYGFGYAEAFADWAEYVAGTQYAFSQSSIQQLVNYYLDGICKMMVYGKYQDTGATNRDITRKKSSVPAGVEIPKKLIAATDYRKSELEDIINIRLGKKEPSESFGVFFWHSEYYTHQRPNYFTSVRMYSTRNANMEEAYNKEGLTNHYRGDGTNYISITGAEYNNTAPVYDWRKIPGTTISQKPSMPSDKKIKKYGLSDFTGAVTDGKYGAVAFDFISPHDSVKVKKAWFFFDDEYVCLGAGITSPEKYPLVTTLNQCLLNGDVTIYSKGKKQVLDKGERICENTQWIYHNGVGYLSPKPITMNLSNKTSSGSWYKVNKQSKSSKQELNIDMFTLWIDHGTLVKDAQYQYIVMPATSIEKVESASKKPSVEILSNTTDIQSVTNHKLNISQVIFYKKGNLNLTDGIQIGMNDPGIIMIKTDGTNIKEIAVSDPSRKLEKLSFTINKKINGIGENYQIKWDNSKGISYITIDLPQTVYAGKSVRIIT